MEERRLAEWRGKAIDSMTREELIDALNICAQQNRDAFEQHSRTLETMGAFAKARRKHLFG